MGAGLSKHNKYRPYPLNHHAPQPSGGFMPQGNGFAPQPGGFVSQTYGYMPGFVPAQHFPQAMMPAPQLSSIAQPVMQMPQPSITRKKKTTKKKFPVFPNGYTAQTAGHFQRESDSSDDNPPFYPPRTMQSVASPEPPSRSAHQQSMRGPAPPPLFTPMTGNELANFPSPQIAQGSSTVGATANRRAATPFISQLVTDDISSDETSQQLQQQSDNGYGNSASVLPRAYSQIAEAAPTYNYPAIDDNIARVLAPLTPAPSHVYGPTEPSYQQSLRNPLPPPPRDLYEMSPYKALLTLPQTTALLTATNGGQHGIQIHRTASVSNPNFKKPKKGLFRAFSTTRRQDNRHDNNIVRNTQTDVRFVPVFISSQDRLHRQEGHKISASRPSGSSQSLTDAIGTATSAPVPPNIPEATSALAPFSLGHISSSASASVIEFSQQSPYAGFMNHSAHRVIYQNKTYPTATHLHEAMKYIDDRPDIAESIRSCLDVTEIYPLSARYQQFERSDWGQVFLKIMEDVLFLKFKQHPDLRALLLGTGNSFLVYSDSLDPFWGNGPIGRGANELGKALAQVRLRLRDEGYS